MAFTGSRYLAAWNDLGADGDGLGVAVRAIIPGSSPPTTAPSHANTTTLLSQFDPDIVWTGAEAVVAWTDASSVVRGLDVKARRFTAELAPLGPEILLATTAADERDVVLATFGSTYAAAWRVLAGADESTVVWTPTGSWKIGPFVVAGCRPTLAPLDASHLIVGSCRTMPADGGATSTIQLTVIDVATSTLSNVTLADAVTSLRDPVLALAGTKLFVGYHLDSTPGSALGEELQFRELTWAAGVLGVGTPLTVPRLAEHRAGDQRRLSMSGSSTALVLAWEDLGRTIAGETTPDVVIQKAPLPLLRL